MLFVMREGAGISDYIEVRLLALPAPVTVASIKKAAVAELKLIEPPDHFTLHVLGPDGVAAAEALDTTLEVAETGLSNKAKLVLRRLSGYSFKSPLALAASYGTPRVLCNVQSQVGWFCAQVFCVRWIRRTQPIAQRSASLLPCVCRLGLRAG